VLKRFWSDISANIAVPAVVGLLGAATLVGGLADFVGVSSQQAELQEIADAAALSAIREVALNKASEQRLEFIATAYVAGLTPDRDIKTDADANLTNNTIVVTVQEPPRARFPGPFSRMETVSATSTAEFLGSPGNVCMIGLHASSSKTVYLDSNAHLFAPECAVYSNSTSTGGLESNSNAVIEAEAIYTSGGAVGSSSNFSDAPITDSEPIGDPLSMRSTPPVGACDHVKREVKDVTTTILPGTYCDGLTINGNARVTFASGVYIIKDGPLVFDSNAEVQGTGVGFFLTGKDAYFEFNSNADVSFSAPETGDMAGLLIFEDPANDKTEHVIKSNYANYMVGTVYLPKSKLTIDADTPVSDQSEFTILVAQKIELNSSLQLFLNTDYHLTTVPVPDGVGPSEDAAVRLIE